MPAPRNRLKKALAEGRTQIGLWLALASPTVAEIAADSGFDWCLIDAEHGTSDIPLILAQLQAMSGGRAAPVVRVPAGEAWMLKRVLDLGAQTVLVPMVDSAAQAAGLVRAVRYAPQGMRGQGAAITRASRYGAIGDYVTTANREICLIVQAETRRAIGSIEAIAATEGVDCVFIGPADLACDMGYPGNPDAPEVQAAIESAICRIRAAGKAAGLLPAGHVPLARYRDLGATFLGVGADVTLLGAAMAGLVNGVRAELG